MTETKHWNAAVCIGAGALFGAVITALGVNALSADAGAWLSFAGSIIGGGMTLVAGWIAWAAAQQQIAEVRRPGLERARQAEAILIKYVDDWLVTIQSVIREITIMNPDCFSAGKRFDVHENMGTAWKICKYIEVCEGYVSARDIKSMIFDIKIGAYIEFVDFNGEKDEFMFRIDAFIKIALNIEKENGQVPSVGFGSAGKRKAYDNLLESAIRWKTRGEALKQALSQTD